MTLYEHYGYKKVTPSTYSYSSERRRLWNRHILISAIGLLLLALVGMALLMIPMIAVTPR